MNGQSPSNGFWLPSPQYSESGWVHGSPDPNSQYFHYEMPVPEPRKHFQNQEYQNRSSGPGQMTPGLTPQSQSQTWQAPYHPDLSAQQQSHPSLSCSFMQQFDNANIEDQLLNDHNLEPSTPGFPLQTPPPTRDSRRKPQQPRLPDFATPPTIRKRPMSSSGGGGGPAVSPDLFNYNTDASPFPFTPLQFSPPQGYPPPGEPMTAPAQHGNVFWDAHSFPNFEPTFPTIAEDPFSSTPAPAAQHFSFSSPAPLMHHRYAASESYQGAPLHPHLRPQTARPMTAGPMHAIPAGINPNVLRASQSFTGQPETFRPIVAAPSTPYATQKAALQREKSARAKKAAARPSLRRANTDSTVSRSESPLKRQKSNANPPMGTFTATPRRREVVLTIDEHGHASTKVIGDPLPPGSYSLAATDEEESDDGVEGSISVASDAQAAIKELRKK